MQFIDLKTQYHHQKASIDSRMRAVMEHGQFIMGPEVRELEETLANYVGAEHCISVSSGTHSLEIALRALGVGPGDEVITPTFSWISSAEVVMLVGATPVFVDIDPDTYLADINHIERAITENTKAIIPVSLFGQMPDLEAISTLAAKHDITVIEDAAQSFGASQKGVKSCGASMIGSTSFFPAKPLGCYGDGGALFTSDAAIAERMRAIRTHGGIKRHHHTLVGTNGRFDTLQAAALLGKWPYFEDEVLLRGQIGAQYSQLLSGLNSAGLCKTPFVLAGNTHVYAQYTLSVPPQKRDEIRAMLKEQDIPTGIYYPTCFHEQPVFASLGYRWGDFPESEKASRSVLSLPMHPYLTEEALEKTTTVIKSYFKS